MRSPAPRSRRRRSTARLRAVVVIHAAGTRGTPSRGQRAERVGERVLQCVLGEAEVAAEPPREGRQDGGTLVAEGSGDGVAGGRAAVGTHPWSKTMTGRTSTDPCSMCGAFPAHSSAVSRSGTSMT